MVWNSTIRLTEKLRRVMQVRRTFSTRVVYNVYSEMEGRKLIAQATSPTLKEHLETPTTIYCGFDPTASSLHLGHLFSLITLLRFHQHGHRSIALIGGATGTIGDPSGKRTERPELASSVVKDNQESLKEQISNFFTGAIERLSFDQTNRTMPIVLNNIDWLGKLGMIEFINSTGRYARMSSMLTRESVKARLDSPQGLSFTEFSYQLFQAYDFWHLHHNYDCTLQLGGGDQWGNIIAGVDLIHKKPGPNSKPSSKKAFGLTTPLLTTSSGEKIGKSAGNALWLDPKKTSPYHFYQYFMKVKDEDLFNLLVQFTFFTPTEAQDIYDKHMLQPDKLNGQRTLARAVTEIVHGTQSLGSAELATHALFDKSSVDLKSIQAEQLDKAFGLIDLDFFQQNATGNDLVKCITWDKIATQPLSTVAYLSGLTNSKGEANRLIKSGGLYLNHQRVMDKQTLDDTDLIAGRWGLLLRSGKSKYVVVRVI